MELEDISDRVWGDPQKSHESAFVMCGKITADAKQNSLLLDDAEDITPVSFDIKDGLVDEVQQYCSSHNIGLDACTFMMLAGIEHERLLSNAPDSNLNSQI